MKFNLKVSLILGLYLLLLTNIFSQTKTGSLKGKVIDADSNQPVGFTYLLIDNINFWEQINSDGSFFFDNLPSGQYLIKTHRIGYEETQLNVNIVPDQITEIVIEIKSKPMKLDDITLSANRIRNDSSLDNPDQIVSDKKLRQNLGMTIAKTLENEPGISQISMGPAPARPVLRGLGGDRLLLLEDNNRTGDLSATSADHAVSIDPLTTNRIEVLRGPEALIYGSNAVGGVINIIRGTIPKNLSKKTKGSLNLQSESVTKAFGSSFDISVPLNQFVLRSDFSIRNSQNMQTPIGELRNTGTKTLNGSAGLSLIKSWGHIGISGGVYDSEYGIPPDPIGGHPGGVDIDMLRQFFTTEGSFNLNSKLFNRLRFKYQYSRYQHEEIEATGTIGMEFGVVTNNANVDLYLSDYGVLKNARVGLWIENRDYASGGLTFTPNSKELTGAAYFYNEYISGKWSFNGIIRFDKKIVEPDEKYYSQNVGKIRERNFFGFSGALSGHYHFLPNFMFGATIMKTFRAPGVEELFSEGPHLAAYSYEIGNSNLDEETGIGLEVFSEYDFKNGNLRIAFFRNEIDNYIFPKNTNERSLRRADLFLYQYRGLNALMTGFELSGSWIPADWISFSMQLQNVQGELKELNQNIPRIPPMSGKFSVSYHSGSLSIGLDTKGAFKQDRVGEFEKTTEGYILNDLSLQYLFSQWNMLHTISFNIENIGDVEYRRHLNRIKEIMPEAGRNFKLLYKLFF